METTIYKFKVGDKIKVKDTSNVRSYNHNGAEKSIGRTFILTQRDIETYHLNNNQYGCNYLDDDWGLISSCDNSEKPKFKVGDRVKKISDATTKHSANNIPIGTVGTITKIGYIGIMDYKHDYAIDYDGYDGHDTSGNDSWLELVEEKNNHTWTSSFYKTYFDELSYWNYNVLLNNDSTCGSEKKTGGFMSKITTFVKNSLLSADERLLRRFGLKGEYGDYTSEARELVIQKLINDNEAYLIEQAKGLEKEEAKNK